MRQHPVPRAQANGRACARRDGRGQEAMRSKVRRGNGLSLPSKREVSAGVGRAISRHDCRGAWVHRHPGAQPPHDPSRVSWGGREGERGGERRGIPRGVAAARRCGSHQLWAILVRCFASLLKLVTGPLASDEVASAVLGRLRCLFLFDALPVRILGPRARTLPSRAARSAHRCDADASATRRWQLALRRVGGVARGHSKGEHHFFHVARHALCLIAAAAHYRVFACVVVHSTWWTSWCGS